MGNLLHFARTSQISIWLFIAMLPVNSHAQTSQYLLDSLMLVLKNHPEEDSVKVDIYAALSMASSSLDKYQCIVYLNEALRITQKIKNKDQEAGILIMLGFAQMEIGESVKSIENFQTLLKFKNLSESTRNLALNFIGLNYKSQGDLDKALAYSKEADRWKTIDPRNIIMQPYNYGDIYFKKKQIDSALVFGKKAFQNLSLVPQWVRDQFSPQITGLVGDAYILMNQKDSAYHYIHSAIEASHRGKLNNYNNVTNEIASELSLANWFDKWGSKDSVYVYGKIAYNAAEKLMLYDLMRQSAILLKNAYTEDKKYAQALRYQELATAAKDSLQGVEKVKKTQAMHYEYRLKEQQIENLKTELRLNNRVKLLGLTSLFIGVAGVFLFTNIQRRKKTIRQLNDQNLVIETQKTQLGQYIDELREKQAQLIQSEKMASLGELTAGIAHEIQNPLNFVNNFSAINTELIEELRSEQFKTVRDKTSEEDILSTLQENSKKIELHGKRAENIVRSMLQHSLVNSEAKTDTEINSLAEEYLKLSYHAMRAKDNNFHVNITTDLDPRVSLLKAIPGDLGRVLLNIYNNAFYSMNEKRRLSSGSYTPALHIRSLAGDQYMTLIIKDTGLGISKVMQNKIFQPFFTTKPTGNGTGLGLSLSYDIITKAHGGSLEVDSVEGEYCSLIIRLPV